MSDDDYHVSAVNFAMRSIRHLNWNYAFYFEGVKSVGEFSDRFGTVGSMEAVGRFVEALTAISAAPASIADELYKKRHESSAKSSDALAAYSPDEIARIRKALVREYRIYRELKRFSVSRAD